MSIKKIYLSPSSQEHNAGPAGTGYLEEVYMNRIADILAPELVRHGFELLRNKPENDFHGHITESNRYKPDYHLAIHSNASGAASSHTARGCVVYCYKPADPTRPGTKLANSIYKRLEQLTPVTDRGVRDGSKILSEIAYTDAPAVLIEVDFHDNLDGATWLMNHIAEIAQAILLGVLDAAGIDFIPAADLTKLLYRVQCGAFHSRANAEALQARLIAAGFNAIIVTAEVT